MSAYYITTAIEYANGAPHLGHAFEKIGADAIARYRRLQGYQVRLLVGTDEHGQKVARAAVDAGRSPAAQAAYVTDRFREAWDALGISYTEFSHTTDPRHVRGVLALIDRIRARDPDAFYERTYEGRYCVGCESFKSAHDVVNDACPLHPTQGLERVAETNWFFRLSKYQSFLRRFLEARPQFIQPASRCNEILALVDRGLDDVSITRANLDWGIPFPIESTNGRHQVIYVWFDALPNYLTAVGYPAPGFEAWPAQLHVIGKDITRFHCVLWPAILHAAALPLPEQVWAHGFLSVDGRRLSKSEGVWIDLQDAVVRHGSEALRYYLLREIPFDGDGDFSWRRFDARYTSDLANTLGNLVSRVTALSVRHDDGRTPSGDTEAKRPIDLELAAHVATCLTTYVDAFEQHRPHRALDAVFELLASGNEYVTRTAPWALARDEACRPTLELTLWTLVRLLAQSAVLLSPALPATAQDIWTRLGGPGCVHDQRIVGLEALDPSGWRVTQRAPLFPRTPTS